MPYTLLASLIARWTARRIVRHRTSFIAPRRGAVRTVPGDPLIFVHATDGDQISSISTSCAAVTTRCGRFSIRPACTAVGAGAGLSRTSAASQESFERQEEFFERALSDGKEGYMRCGKDGRSIVTAIPGLPIPTSAIELKKQLKDHMPERQLLEAITNSEHWTAIER